MIKLLFFLLLLPLNARAAIQGKLDLSELPHGGFAREGRDGNWLASLAWAPGQLLHDGVKIAHAGVLQGWRVDRGDPATCLLVGLPTGSLGSQLAKLGNHVDLPSMYKPLAFVGDMISIDGFGGYRFQHGPDVHSWVYGVNFQLTYQFGNDDLKRGL